MTPVTVDNTQFPYQLGILEFLVHTGTAILLAAKYRGTLPEEHLILFVGGIAGIGVLRLILLFAVYRTGETSLFASISLGAGAALAGLAWGNIPLSLILLSEQSIAVQPFLALAVTAATIASLACSAVHHWPPTVFVLPALGIPMAISGWMGQAEQLAMWGFLFLVVMLSSRSNSYFVQMAHRYRQLSRGNTELMKSVANARDAAVLSRKETEQANAKIKEEIIERQRAEEKIRASEQELSNILNDMQDTFFRTDRQGNIIRISPSVEQLLGYSPEQLLGKPGVGMFTNESAHAAFMQVLDKKFGITQNQEVLLRHQQGHEVWASVNAHYHMDTDGKPSGIDVTARDITETRRAAEALHQEKERLHITLESIGDGVISTDIHGIVEYINPVGEGITGWSLAEARGQPLDTVLHLIDEDESEVVSLPSEKWLVKGKQAALDRPAMLVHRLQQSESAIELTGAPIRDSKQEVIGSVLVFRDVTKLRSLAKQLSYQATHDALTGLINRVEFDKRVKQAISSANGSEKVHALCYLDLDNFKVVNDTCGHHAGDELLKQITRLLQDNLRESDTLARLGGDEFGILLSGCPLDKAADIADTLRQRVEDFRFISEGKAFRIGLSIGVVPITGSTSGMTELLSSADAACYVAKERGRNYVHVFQPDDEAVAEHHGQMQWMQRIQRALDEDLFELHIQSIVSVEQPYTDIAHGELLLRMIDDQKPEGEQLITPNAFIPAAERYQLMPQIDCWVVRNALQALANQHEFSELTTCGINLSGQSMCDLKLLDYILEVIKETGVSPDRLCFEITESAVIANLDIAREFITRMKNIGCRFALDDFGSGLSSFAYLKNLPVDYVKLDGSLITDVANSKVSQAMVHAINYVTHIMGMKSIAEYVSSDAILESLKAISIDYAQGYAIDKPRPFARAARKSAKPQESLAS